MGTGFRCRIVIFTMQVEQKIRARPKALIGKEIFEFVRFFTYLLVCFTCCIVVHTQIILAGQVNFICLCYLNQ